MALTVLEQLQRLVLSANEIKDLTGWPDALIEDYLNILENTVILAEAIDDVPAASRVQNITKVVSDPYQVQDDDEIILVDATAEEINIILMSSIGQEGTTYIIEKIDSTDNKVIVDGRGTELINGEETFELLLQYESIEPTAVSITDFGSNWLI